MNLPAPPETYDQRDQSETRRTIESADLQTHKRNQDVEIGDGRLILKDIDGVRYNITVSTGGALTVTAFSE